MFWLFKNRIMGLDKVDSLRMAIQDALCNNHKLESRTNALMHVFSEHQQAFDGITIGWLDVRTKAPELNMYVDIKYQTGISNEMLVTPERLNYMRNNDAQRPPAKY